LNRRILKDKKTGEDFLPSTHGFQFSNGFKDGRYAGVFNHANGLCGGMAFAIRDYHESANLPPQTDQVPTVETNKVLLDFIAERQVDSVSQKSVGNYFSMPKFQPNDVQKLFDKVKKDINENHLSILGLIRAQSIFEITKNHQVGCYGFTEDSLGNVNCFVYDPGLPLPGSIDERDRIYFSFNYQNFTEVTCSHPGLGTIYYAFHPSYNYKVPPGITIDYSKDFLQKVQPT